MRQVKFTYVDPQKQSFRYLTDGEVMFDFDGGEPAETVAEYRGQYLRYVPNGKILVVSHEAWGNAVDATPKDLRGEYTGTVPENLVLALYASVIAGDV